VCSNSLRAASVHHAVGLLKEEMRRCDSLLMAVADACRVPAGGALAVDRERFSAEVTQRIDAHPAIERIAARVDALPQERPVVLATGPLTSDALAAQLAALIGREHLAYYDSVAPIVAADSIDMDQVFAASRYDKGGDDAYLNCPLDRAQYDAFIDAVLAAEKVAPHAFEQARYFEGCLPLEVMAERGRQTLSFGPMKPVGLTDPRTGRRPYAVVQLRREDAQGSAYNIVGFQTRMTQPEQRRVLALIPGLAAARFERFGSVHRNTFVNAPQVLDDRLQLRAQPGVYLAGQITGVEGYVESAACGLCVGVMLAQSLAGAAAAPPPPTTALGALLGHLRRPQADFQPSNVVWSMFPPLAGKPLPRKRRREELAARALRDVAGYGESFSAAASAAAHAV
jgi:methylenetetrahydrofolate--tRNA-(uracil-5-)-methyltransferase